MKFTTTNIAELRLAMATQGKDDVRYYLNAICFDLAAANDGDTQIDIPLVGTDGAVISMSPVRLEVCEDLPVGKDLILYIAGTIPKTARSASFDTDAGVVRLLLKNGNSSVLGLTLIDETYPNYARLMEPPNLGHTEVEAIAFSVKCLTKVIQAVGNKDGSVKLEFSDGAQGLIGVSVYGMEDSIVRLMPLHM